MKPRNLLVLAAILFIQAGRISPEPTTFVASTPCDRIPRTMLSIPQGADCEFIKWNLKLQRDPRNQQPTGYRLDYTYGMSQPGTMGFRNGGTSQTKEGTWRIKNETDNRVIYWLESATPETALPFVKLDDNLLHLLDPAGNLMIGHAGWSYTLNRK